MSAVRRKILQIMTIPAVSGGVGTQDMYALCNDGTLWLLEDLITGTADWVQMDTTTLSTAKATYNA